MHVFFVIFYLLDFIEQYGSLPPPPPASVLEDPLVTGTSRDPLLPLGVFLFELTLFICIIFYKNIKEIFHESIEFFAVHEISIAYFTASI